MPVDPDAILGQSHDLEHEFPEYTDLIHELQEKDDTFARLCDEYHNVNRETIRIEQCVEARSHDFFADLKRRRLQCKDKVYTILRHGGTH